MALVDYLIQPGEMTTPEAADRKRKMAMLLQQQGTDTSPVDHWTQGAARVVNALSGRLREAKADRDEEFSRKEGAKDEAPLMAALFGGGGGAPATGGVAGALAGPNINTADSEFEGGGHTQKVRTYASIGDNPIAKQAFNFYVSKGLSPHAAAGLVGQFAQESNFNPGIWNKGEGAFGLAQWRGDRLAGLQRYAASVGKNPNDPQVQLEYSWQELNGPEKATLTALQNARDPHSATAAAIGYERPAGWTSQNPVAGHGFGNRLAAATAAASAFGGQQQPTQVAQADIPAPGAQPAEYQIPGQAQPQAQGGGMTPAVAMALRTMNNPYASPVAKMAAKAIIERAGAVADPLKQAEMEEYNYKKSQRPQEEAKRQAEIAKTLQDMERGAIGIEEGKLKLQQLQNDIDTANRQRETGIDESKLRDLNTQRQFDIGAPASPKDEMELRKEIQQLPSYKNYSQARPVYEGMVKTAGTNSKASDLNLVYGLGKIMDPGSVVREGEMVMVKNSAGLPEWLVGAINSLNGGAALTPETRKAILAEARGRMQSYTDQFNVDVGQYRDIAKGMRAREDMIIPRIPDLPVWEPAPPPPADRPAGAPLPNSAEGWQDAPVKGYKIRQVK